MSKRGLLLVFLTALVSGFAIFINKFGVSGVNPYIFTFSKNILVAIFVVSIILFFKEFNNLKKISKKNWLKLTLIGFFGGSIPFLLFFKGLQLTAASKAAFLHKTMFVYVIILASVFLKERIKKSLVIAGILLLIGNALLLKFVWQALNIGDLLIIIATVFWAVENTISKYTLKDLSSHVVIFGRMFFGSLFIIFFLLITNQLKVILTLNIQQLSWILLSSIILLLYVMTWYTGLKNIRVSVATCVLMLGSFITTSLNYLFLDTSLTFTQAIGMFLLLAGIIFAVGISQIHGIIKYIVKWCKKWIQLN